VQTVAKSSRKWGGEPVVPHFKTVTTIKWSRGCEGDITHAWDQRCQAGCLGAGPLSRPFLAAEAGWSRKASARSISHQASREQAGTGVLVAASSQARGMGELTLQPRQSQGVGDIIKMPEVRR
jgi:hypothetical protein